MGPIIDDAVQLKRAILQSSHLMLADEAQLPEGSSVNVMEVIITASNAADKSPVVRNPDRVSIHKEAAHLVATMLCD